MTMITNHVGQLDLVDRDEVEVVPRLGAVASRHEVEAVVRQGVRVNHVIGMGRRLKRRSRRCLCKSVYIGTTFTCDFGEMNVMVACSCHTMSSRDECGFQHETIIWIAIWVGGGEQPRDLRAT